jgi:hypothetical protein
LNLYRANALASTDHANVRIPVLGVSTSGDIPLTEAQLTQSSRYVEGPWRYERFNGPSHWFPLEIPKQLCELLVEFFRGVGQRLEEG